MKFWGIEIIYHDGGEVIIKYPIEGFSNQIMYFLIFCFLGTLVPIFINFYLYLQVSKALKAQAEDSGEKSSNNSNRVLWYSFIQFICFVPGVFTDCFYMFQGEYPPMEVAAIVGSVRRTWGFLNLLAYWFVRMAEDERKKSVEYEHVYQEYRSFEASF